MTKATINSSKVDKKSHKPISPEGRERQNIALAENLAEQKLRDGTASSQLIVHYLKLGTAKEQLEQEKLKRENELLEAKKDNLETEQKSAELFEKALKAFTSYSGGVYNDE